MNSMIEKTHLWLAGIGARDPDQAVERKKERLRSVLSVFRERANTLTTRIAATFPELTIHDVSHLDALWETADLLAGPKYPLNPMEAFVFGGAILLHDAAHCFEAYEGGRVAVRSTVEWRDALASETDAHLGAAQADLEHYADFTAIRILHARQSQELGEREWKSENDASSFFLIEDSELRTRYGSLIGQIAASHNWTIEDVQSRLRPQVNAPGDWPVEWRVDPIKLACLLRCADAAHIDNRRAPDFLLALIRRSGISFEHWRAQNWLSKADIDQSDANHTSLLITSNHPFGPSEAASWWVAYDAICLLDAEIRASNSLLLTRVQRDSSSPPFAIRRVTGAGSPRELNKSIEAQEWIPTDAKIHVGNLKHLVETLGGKNLYGTAEEGFPVVLRELIQNARDAVAARKALQGDYDGKILIRIKVAQNRTLLEVQDNGVGMSERTMTGALLDFGTSFWTTDLVKSEFPGLRSSSFRPVGRFGIGFYSVFMIAAAVTVSSRRYDEGLLDVTNLDFEKGLSLRPTLSKKARPGYDVMSTTSVQLILSQPIAQIEKRKISVGQSHQNWEIPLQDYLSVIVAGLDVPVFFQNGDGAPIQIHTPISNIVDDAGTLAWLSGISFSNLPMPPGGNDFKKYVRENAKRMRKIYQDGKLAGFAALLDLQNSFQLLTTDTIGGLTSNVVRGGGGYLGYMDSVPNSAKRDSQKKVASIETLQAWANEQIDILRGTVKAPINWYWVASHMANLELDPISILPFPIISGQNMVQFLAPDQVLDLLKQSKLSMGISQHDLAEINMPYMGIENLPTLRPLGPGNLIRCAIEDAKPKFGNGLIGCLDRYVRGQGRKISYSTRPTPVRTMFGTVSALVLTLE